MDSEKLSTANKKSSGPTSRRRLALKIVGVILLFVITISVTLVYLRRVLPRGWDGKHKLAITSGVEKSYEHPYLVNVGGKLSESGRIALYLNDTFVGETATEADHSFAFVRTVVRPGENRLKLLAFPLDATTSDFEPATSEHTVNPTEADPERPYILLPKNYVVNTTNVNVTGVTVPNTKLFVQLAKDNNEGGLQGEGDPVPTQSDDEGKFQAVVSFPATGTYYVAAKSDPKEPISERWTHAKIEYDPFRASKTNIVIGYYQTTIDYEVTLARDSADARSLIMGAMPVPQFMADVSGLKISEGLVAFDFWDVDPIISTTNEAITVRARAIQERSAQLPVLHGRIFFQKWSTRYLPQFPVTGGSHSICVRVNDYSVRSYYPVPNYLDNGQAVWTGERPPTDLSTEIQIGIDYNPLKSPARFFRFLSLSPWQLVGYQASVLFAPLNGFLASIPIIWVLWQLQRRKDETGIDPELMARFRLVAFVLLVLVFVGPMMIAAPILVNRYRVWSSSIVEDRLPFVRAMQIGIGVLAFSFGFLLATKKFASRRALFWVRESLAGLGIAAGVSMVLTATIEVFELPYGSMRSKLPIIIVCFFAMTVLIVCTRALISFLPAGHLVRSRILWLLVVLSSVALGYPIGVPTRTLPITRYYTIEEVTVSSARHLFFLIQELAPYVLLIGIVIILRSVVRRVRGSIPDDFGWLLFAAFIVGSTQNWFLIPIPFLLALWLYPRIVAERPDRREALELLGAEEHPDRALWFKTIARDSQAAQLMDSLRSLAHKVSSGELSLREYQKRKIEIENYNSVVESESSFPGDLRAKDIALSFGPLDTDWENGVYAAKRGLLIALPFLMLYFWKFVLQEIGWGRTLLVLWLAIRVVTFAADWALAAFFFGYFFPYIRGSSGLTKGLHIAIAIILCFTPIWFISGSSAVELTASFLRAGQIFLFFTILGIWAFDYKTFRQFQAGSFSWKKFAQFGDMPSLTAFASVLLTSGGLAIGSVISGQFANVLSHLVTSLIPQLPAPPTK